MYFSTEKLEKVGEAAESILKIEFQEYIEDINFNFLSSDKVNAWIKIKKIDAKSKNTIKNYLQAIFSYSNVNSVNIQWIGENDELPSLMQILIATKKLQPVIIEKYVSEFKEDYPHIHIKWLNRQLDKLIKKNLIVRNSISKGYAVTGKGLDAIPTAANSMSSDIARALSLGKRKW